MCVTFTVGITFSVYYIYKRIPTGKREGETWADPENSKVERLSSFIQQNLATVSSFSLKQ